MASKDTLSKKQIDYIVERATEQATAIYKRERAATIKKARDWRLHNVKLLLRHYNQLKAYSEDMTEEFKDFGLIWDTFGIQELSTGITNNNVKTVIIMQHVDFRLRQWKDLCKTSEDLMRYKLIYDLYLTEDPITIQKAADKYHLARNTVYREIDKACKTLAILFFGVDGITNFTM